MKPIYLMLLPVVGLALSTVDVGAQTWPAKPLRAVVPVGAGSTTDIVPRVVLEQLSSQLGQSISWRTLPARAGQSVIDYVPSDPDG